jgi:hypothetical protein
MADVAYWYRKVAGLPRGAPVLLSPDELAELKTMWCEQWLENPVLRDQYPDAKMPALLLGRRIELFA